VDLRDPNFQFTTPSDLDRDGAVGFDQDADTDYTLRFCIVEKIGNDSACVPPSDDAHDEKGPPKGKGPKK